MIKLEKPERLVPYLVEVLKERLGRGEKVLWLVAGGSAIGTAVAVSKHLQDAELSNLYVTLMDERYGPIDHPDENWKQLLDTGFDLPGAHTYRVITGTDRAETAAAFEAQLKTWFTETDYRLGLFGIGPDGHTSGVKPHSPAVTSKQWVVDYTWEEYERITATPAALSQLDEAVIYAVGEAKFKTLAELTTTDQPLTDMPAQLLKQIKKSTLFTDYEEA